jgi:hypothetical protein
MTHIAIQEKDDHGEDAFWDKAVSDQEYPAWADSWYRSTRTPLSRFNSFPDFRIGSLQHGDQAEDRLQKSA